GSASWMAAGAIRCSSNAAAPASAIDCATDWRKAAAGWYLRESRPIFSGRAAHRPADPEVRSQVKSSYNCRPVPGEGKAIEFRDSKFQVPDNPIIPFIEGDGTGRDIWKASRAVFDAAVEKAYVGKRRIAWFEILAGEKAFSRTHDWLPDETVDAIRD